jgi:hypothetical protein
MSSFFGKMFKNDLSGLGTMKEEKKPKAAAAPVAATSLKPRVVASADPDLDVGGVTITVLQLIKKIIQERSTNAEICTEDIVASIIKPITRAGTGSSPRGSGCSFKELVEAYDGDLENFLLANTVSICTYMCMYMLIR